MGAIHTFEGKDYFGITSAHDMEIYLENLYSYFLTETDLSKELKSYMTNASYEIIEKKNVSNHTFTKKYGSFDIAYHEVGIVFDSIPYILIILTQKGKEEEQKKKAFINKVAYQIKEIHRKGNKK